MRILFVHCSPANCELCLHELDEMRLTVSANVAATPEEVAVQLRLGLCDLLVAEHPSTNWQETQPLGLLGQMKKDIPVIFSVDGMKRETAADFILKGHPSNWQRDSLCKTAS